MSFALVGTRRHRTMAAHPDQLRVPPETLELRPKMGPGWISVFGLPLARVALAVTAQLGLALAFAVTRGPGAWRWAAGWWVAWLVPVNLATMVLLMRRQRAEGHRFGELFGPPSRPPRRDLPWYLLALVVSVPLGILPNLLMARLLWGSAFAGAAASFATMPIKLVWLLAALVPVTQGLTEPPLYLGYLLPRLRCLGMRPGRAIAVTAATMSLQNVFFPWSGDWRFALWRALMLLPLCLWLAWLVGRRPSLLPYLAVAHGVMNLSLVFLVLRLSLPFP